MAQNQEENQIPPQVNKLRWRFLLLTYAGLLAALSVLVFNNLRAYREVEVSRALWAAIQNVGSAIVVTDDNGVIKTWSEGAQKLTGWPFSEVEGKNIEFLIPEEMVPQHRAKVKENIDNRKLISTQLDCSLIAKDRRHIPVRVTVRALPYSGFVAVLDPIE